MRRSTLAIFLLFLLAPTSCSHKGPRPEQAPAEAPPAEESVPEVRTPPPPNVLQTTTPVNEGAKDWSYDGSKGPEQWGQIRPEYRLCTTGKNQSPIDLKWSKPKTDGGRIDLTYIKSPLKVLDNGSTIVIKMGAPNKANLHGEEYELEEIRFHSTSEHTLSGNSLPMEAQFVHKNAKGEIAILSTVLIHGVENPEIEKVWQNLPKGRMTQVEVSGIDFNPWGLLPSKFTHYYYLGSLTQPPCTEGVKWFVLNTPVELSERQIVAFRARYDHNARPVQPLNRRKVVNY